MWKNFIHEMKKDQQRGRSLLQIRHYLKWRASQGSSSVKDRSPWITFDAIEILKRHVTKSSSVFEFGAGGSTLFFLDHAKTVFSVEHDVDWLNILKQNLSEEECKRWTPILAEPEENTASIPFSPSDPEGYLSSADSYDGKSFKTYATSIESCGESRFDVVVVDGRARPSCIIHSLNKVKLGGLLIVDNADRKYYLEKTIDLISRDFTPILRNLGATPYTPEFTETAIWQKCSR